MTIREQIVTVKVRYDDGEENKCTPSEMEECIGTTDGVCCDTNSSPVDYMTSDGLGCCYEYESLEILQSTEPREVLTEKNFE